MDDKAEIIEMTTDIVSAYVGNNSVSAADLPALIQSVHKALTGVSGGVEDALQAFLTLTESFFRLLARGDIDTNGQQTGHAVDLTLAGDVDFFRHERLAPDHPVPGGAVAANDTELDLYRLAER